MARTAMVRRQAAAAVTAAAALAAAAGLAGCERGAGPEGSAGALEEYRRAAVVSEPRWNPADPRRREEHEAALARYREAVAARAEAHPGYADAFRTWQALEAGGETLAGYHLGILHLYGLGGAAFDQVRALALIRRAAEHGYPPAQTFMGLLAETGDGTMVLADERLALEWYTHGAGGGHCAGVRRLVRVYEEGGLGAAADAAEAARWRARLGECRKR